MWILKFSEWLWLYNNMLSCECFVYFVSLTRQEWAECGCGQFDRVKAALSLHVSAGICQQQLTNGSEWERERGRETDREELLECSLLKQGRRERGRYRKGRTDRERERQWDMQSDTIDWNQEKRLIKKKKKTPQEKKYIGEHVRGKRKSSAHLEENTHSQSVSLQSASGPEPTAVPLMFVALIYRHITLTADMASLRLHPIRYT